MIVTGGTMNAENAVGNGRSLRVTQDIRSFQSPMPLDKYILGDARDLRFMEDNSVDLIIAHPPYLDMMDYGPVATVKDV